MSNNQTEIKKTNTFWPIIIAILICIVLLGIAPILSKWYASFFFNEDLSSLEKVGQFGDGFGFGNALISAAAFAGVIVSMYLQRKDLELQRKSLEIQQEELRNNTEELRAQRTEFETQNKTMKLQRFENTFFNMLSLHNEITNSLNIETISNRLSGAMNSDNVRGREVFKLFYKNITKIGVRDIEGLQYQLRINQNKAMVYQSYPHISLLDHYFRNILQILRFIDGMPDSVLPFEGKKNYSTIVISTFSEYELVFLFFNAIHFNDCDMPEYMEYVNKYSLLNELRPEIIGVQILEYFKDAFDDSAFTRETIS